MTIYIDDGEVVKIYPIKNKVAKAVMTFLGEDWYVVDPIGQNQINGIALQEILEKHSKKFRKERRRKTR